MKRANYKCLVLSDIFINNPRIDRLKLDGYNLNEASKIWRLRNGEANRRTHCRVTYSLEMTIESGMKCPKGVHEEKRKRTPITSGIGRIFLRFLKGSWIECMKKRVDTKRGGTWVGNRDIRESIVSIREVGVVVRANPRAVGLVTVQSGLVSRGCTSAISSGSYRSHNEIMTVIALRRVALEERKCKGSHPVELMHVPHWKHLSKGTWSTGRWRRNLSARRKTWSGIVFLNFSKVFFNSTNNR